MSLVELKRLFLSDRLNIGQKGALSIHIKIADKQAWMVTAKSFVKQQQELFEHAKFKRIVTQCDLIQYSETASGYCLPLALIVAVAMSKDNPERAINTVANRIIVASGHPSDLSSRHFMQLLLKLHTSGIFSETSTLLGNKSLEYFVKQILSKQTNKQIYAATTSIHTLLFAIDMRADGKKVFYFYEPNLGVYGFDKVEHLMTAVKKRLQLPGIAECYKITDTKKLSFNFYKVNPQPIASLQLDDGTTVGNTVLRDA